MYMKNSIIFLSLAVIVLSLLSSCKKDETLLYQQEAGVYFNGRQTVYSFVENITNKQLGADTVNIPLLITGFALDKERSVLVEVIKDSLSTASNEMFEVIKATIPANSYMGHISLKINYSPLLDDSIYVARFALRSNIDFPFVDLNEATYSVSMTSKFTQPANWSRLRSSFGEYSNSWYEFILKTTELKSLPYWSYRGSADPSNPDPKRWTMTFVEMRAYAALVKFELSKYNNAHPGKPLTHSDGPKKDEPVVMP